MTQTRPAHQTPGTAESRISTSVTRPIRQVTLHRARRESEETTEPSAEPDYLGATIDERYLVEKILGAGGMGVVYRCRHTVIDKLVAMKVLRADLAKNQELTERFLNEARAASSIGNPHIVDVHDFGRLPDGATYFIMEHLEGQPLSRLIEPNHPLAVSRILTIASQITEGLAAAHAAGIVHRDLKPDNLFLLENGPHDDFVKILDFGIAKASRTTERLTQSGQVFGTPHYMSPEQASGRDVDARSDIYTLGVILYELATGSLPFDADNHMGILSQHMFKQPTPFRKLQTPPGGAPAALEPLIFRCLKKDPEARFSSMAELHFEIERLADKLGISPLVLPKNTTRSLHPPSPPLNAREPAGLSPLYIVFGSALLAALVSYHFLHQHNEAKPIAEEILTAPTDTKPLPSAISTAPTPPTARSVTLTISPRDARVFRGTEDWGASPLSIPLDALPLELEVRRAGYDSQRFTLDGSQEQHSLTLRRAAGGALKPPAAPEPTPKASPPASSTSTASPAAKPPERAPTGSELIVNPWE